MSKTQDLIYSAYNNPVVTEKYYQEFYEQDLPIKCGYFDKFLNLLNQGGYVLDLGCGAGQHCEYAAHKGFRVTGVDFSKSMLNVAEKLKSSQDVDYRYGNMLKLEEVLKKNEKFDGIVLCFSLLCFNTKEANIVLQNALKHLKHRGRVFIVTAMETERQIGREIIEEEPFDKRENQYYKYYTQDELENLLRKHGLNDICIEQLITPNPNDAAGAALVATAQLNKIKKGELENASNNKS